MHPRVAGSTLGKPCAANGLVHGPGGKYPGSCRERDGGVDLGNDLVEGSGGPTEGMCVGVPLVDEGENAFFEGIEVGEVGRGHALALQDGKPLLDLVHPRAVHGREVHLKARMVREPRAYQLAVVDAEVVAKQVNERDGFGRVAIDPLEQLDELHLALAAPQDADHLAAARVERREELERTLALVLVL